jgi:hypothetical protein
MGASGGKPGICPPGLKKSNFKYEGKMPNYQKTGSEELYFKMFVCINNPFRATKLPASMHDSQLV